MKNLALYSLLVGSLAAGGASTMRFTTTSQQESQAHLNETSCPGFCYTCGALPLTYAVVPMDHEFSNDADESVACGHHVECRGCLVSSALADTLRRAVDDGDHSLVANSINGEEGWLIRLNEDRSALQVVGCDSAEVTTHINVAPGLFKDIVQELTRISGPGNHQ
ncbi:MAG: hypothetical protein ACT4OZ_02870 [Gemmatimonadota bacterium]